MPSSRRQKPKAKAASRPTPAARKPAGKKPVRPPARPAATAKATGKAGAAPASKSGAKARVAPTAMPVVRRPDGRIHLLSLSFVRDGDEFLARMETDAGQITELKNRALDQLLTLVASELEDLLE